MSHLSHPSTQKTPIINYATVLYQVIHFERAFGNTLADVAKVLLLSSVVLRTFFKKDGHVLKLCLAIHVGHITAI